MKTKRFSVLQLILAVLLTAVVLTGGGLLALRPAFSYGGYSTHFKTRSGGYWSNPIAAPSIACQKPAMAAYSAA